MVGKALVLGGGGVVGVAWEIGILVGLAAAGVDLCTADLFVGTSAGAVVAAQITSGSDLEVLYTRQLTGYVEELPGKMSVATMVAMGVANLRSRDGAAFRRRAGRIALTARTVTQAQRRAVMESRLPSTVWPDRRLLITAVDAESGERIAFDRDAGVPLIDAVGASCAVPGVWPLVSIGGRRFIDGGMSSPTNVDLAAGYERIVVVAPTTLGGGAIPRLSAQIAELRRQAKRVAVVAPDKAARRAFGRNWLDPARRASAARAGRAQAAVVAAEVESVWS